MGGSQHLLDYLTAHPRVQFQQFLGPGLVEDLGSRQQSASWEDARKTPEAERLWGLSLSNQDRPLQGARRHTAPDTLGTVSPPRPPIYHQCNANGAGETPPPAGLGAWMHAPKKQRKEEGLGQKEKKEKLGEKREKTVAGAANRCPEPMPRGEHSPLQGDSGADIPQEPEGLQGLVSARVTLAPVSHSVNEGPGQADPQVTPQKSRCF